MTKDMLENIICHEQLCPIQLDFIGPSNDLFLFING